MDIILLGDPAAGKATQAAKLLKKYKLIDFDMGKTLREIQWGKGNPRLKKILERTYNKGKMTPTYLYRQITKDKILKTSKRVNILFDGHPKQISEAKLVSKWLKQRGRGPVYVLYLSVPEKEIFKRMRNRREYFKGKFSKRPDDTPAAMHRRVKYFRSGIKNVIAFFSKNYPYKKISGLGAKTEVHGRIVKAINEFINKE